MRFLDWFHTIKVFKLEVYDRHIAQFLRNDGPYNLDRESLRKFMNLDYEFLSYFASGRKPVDFSRKMVSFRDELSELPFEGRFAKFIEFAINEKMLNSNWIEFHNFWFQNNQFKHHCGFLFRMIPPIAYKDLLKYGNSTADPIKFPGNDTLEKFDGSEVVLTPSDYISASDFIEKAWERGCKSNPGIIIVYNETDYEDMKTIFKRTYDYLWIRKDTKKDFRDTIVAIIRIKYF